MLPSFALHFQRFSNSEWRSTQSRGDANIRETPLKGYDRRQLTSGAIASRYGDITKPSSEYTADVAVLKTEAGSRLALFANAGLRAPVSYPSLLV